MEHYVANSKSQRPGEHEIHKMSCPNAPEADNMIDFGEHEDCDSALKAARKHFEHVDGCEICNPGCHRQ